ncbi:GntR family transcriptional regulator [Phyllobacterium leguminum]|uniref:GntR family transcriptional regulator n=1 Tax=Phyllobacterium leguminum TaxID=314237 RepID=A0A318T114_9HYPH|nr:GntR family transcriptional regulator [Phyllobacterium leguminum]PYE87967.1 GntR family transcriptional regulator [Phyllobacterium leguminum]
MTSLQFEYLAGDSLAEQGYRTLERLIITLVLEPNMVVTERTLIELTGMGRTPVREAIQRLAWEGLLEVRPRSGIAVSPLDPKDFTKVLDARQGVEQMLARDAARFAGARDRERLEAAATAMREAAADNDIARFLDADKALDAVLGQAATNAFAARLAGPLQTHSRRFWYHLKRDDGLAASTAAHIALIDAILAREPDEAMSAAAKLIGYLRTLAP